MKYSFIFLLSLLLMSQQCKSGKQVQEVTEEQAECIDPAKIKMDAPCVKIYKPVCGCDGVTYANSCLAENNGLLTWTDGACPDSEEETPKE
ncbi:MAG TPA: hypothetical protein VK014_14210 [Cyclobacteriaceae bacterium]|nr:hypothetical protein [Cyclobacteriaceae bacterium]